MKQIEVNKITDNFVELIGKEWMLVSAGDKDKLNTMTASWGGVGFLWGKPVVFVFIRPKRFTREFVEARKSFTLSFLGNENREAYKICGSKSGRDTDKVKEAGLHPAFTPSGNPYFEEARMVLDCKVLFKSQMDEAEFLDPALLDRWYNAESGGMHYIYVAEIEQAFVR